MSINNIDLDLDQQTIDAEVHSIEVGARFGITGFYTDHQKLTSLSDSSSEDSKDESKTTISGGVDIVGTYTGYKKLIASSDSSSSSSSVDSEDDSKMYFFPEETGNAGIKRLNNSSIGETEDDLHEHPVPGISKNINASTGIGRGVGTSSGTFNPQEWQSFHVHDTVRMNIRNRGIQNTIGPKSFSQRTDRMAKAFKFGSGHGKIPYIGAHIKHL